MPDPLPPLTALRAFDAVARTGSLSAAARELNVTHPAVAQQVRRLEEWFEMKLVERAGRGMVTTTAGARLAVGLAEGFGTIARVVSDLARDAEDRPIRATMTPAFAVGWFMPRVGAFRERHPEIEITVQPTSRMIDLAADDYDVAFRFGRGRWPGLEAERIVETNVLPVASPAFLARHPVDTLDDLARVPWVQEPGTAEMGTWLSAHGIDPRGHRDQLNVPGSLLADAVRRGDGVGLIPYSHVAGEIAEGRLVALFEDEADPDLGYYMVRRPGPHRQALRRFLAWAREALSFARPASS